MMIPLILAMAFSATSAPGPVASKPRLAVLPLAANRLPASTVSILNDVLTTAVAAAGSYDVLSVNDLNAMLGFEKLKDVAGCSDVVCGAEIGGALGVELLLTGSVSVLGDELIVQLSLIDTKTPKVTSRGRTVVRNDEKLYRNAIETAAAQVSGVEPRATTDAKTVKAPAPAPAVPKGPRSPARFAFETRDGDYNFEVTVTSAEGTNHTCDPPVRLAAPCILADSLPGDARLNVASGKLEPFVDGFTVRNKNELYPIQIESRAGEGSVIAWGLGGTALGAGVAMLGTGLAVGVGGRGLVYGGVPTALVGAGVVILGFFFERRIDVNYPGVDMLF